MPFGSPLLGYSLAKTLEKIQSIKDAQGSPGAVFYDRIRSSAGGTGTARTAVSTTYAIPDAARELIAWAPMCVPAAPSAAESIAAVFDIQGNNFKYGPVEAYAPVAGQHLTAIQGHTPTPQEWWEVRAPVSPQATYSWGIEPIDAQAGDSRAYIDLMYSTVRTGLPVIHGLATRETALDGAGDSAATTLNVTDAKELVEVAGIATGSTVTADEEIVADMTIRSDSLRPLQQFRFGLQPNTAIEATSGETHIDCISRNPTPGFYFSIVNPAIAGTANLDVDITGAGQSSFLVRYLGAAPDPRTV